MLNRVREWWEGLGRSNQMIAGGAAAASVIALIGFIAWAGTPEYAPLFSNLSAQDANAITEKLKEANVPYRLSGGGTAIEIPAQKRDEMRMKLVSENLPQESSATIGYGVLKEASIGQTSTLEGQTILRAHEGEIAKSILCMNQVAGAIVHIAPGEDSPFTSSKTSASAAVVLTLKSGQQLDADNVRAVLRLVQMSYTGLTDDKITITDSHAMLLHDPMHSSGDASDIHKDEAARSQAKSAELQSMMDRTIGPNKIQILANVELNPDRKTTEKTEVTPGVVTEQKTETEKLQGSPDAALAPVGVTANTGAIPTYDAKSAGGSGSMTHETASKTMTPTIEKSNTVTAPGRIEKLTVSALVDTKVPADQLPSIEKALKTSIGAIPGDATRMVTVTQVSFDHTADEEAAKEAAASRSSENITRLLTSLVPLALMALSLFLLYRALRKPMPRLGTQLALAGAGADGEMMALEPGMLSYDADGNPLPGQTVDSLLNPAINAIGISTASGDPHTFEIIEEAFDAQLESVQHLVKSKPETVAALIKSWTTEDK